MRLYIAAVGRLKKGPEQDLVERYAQRIKKAGKSVGISAIENIEIVESRAQDTKSRKRSECDEIRAQLPEKTLIWALDERGQTPDSLKFAKSIETKINNGVENLALVIGGPDGLDAEFREKCDAVMSFGALTIPHQIVRILIYEQVYRAITILSNHPYHRQ